MTALHMTKTAESPPVSSADSTARAPAFEAGSEISVEDDRWASVEGLIDLIPELFAETLRHREIDPDTRSVSVALVSGAAIRSLNKTFREKDSETNVLSFPSAPALQTAKLHGNETL